MLSEMTTRCDAPALLNPQRFISEEVLRKTGDEIDIAVEIFITQQQAVYYNQLMSEGDGTLASKTKLISWLNDYSKKGKIARPGIITLYRSENPDHFSAGKWEARNIALFARYMVEHLTDPGYVRKSNARIFSDSVWDDNWFLQAVTLGATKLLESLVRTKGLKSVVAHSLLSCTVRERFLLEKMGLILGKAAKNEGLSPKLRKEAQNEIRKLLLVQIRYQQEAVKASNKGEYAIFTKYKGEIEQALFYTRNEFLEERYTALPKQSIESKTDVSRLFQSS